MIYAIDSTWLQSLVTSSSWQLASRSFPTPGVGPEIPFRDSLRILSNLKLLWLSTFQPLFCYFDKHRRSTGPSRNPQIKKHQPNIRQIFPRQFRAYRRSKFASPCSLHLRGSGSIPRPYKFLSRPSYECPSSRLREGSILEPRSLIRTFTNNVYCIHYWKRCTTAFPTGGASSRLIRLRVAPQDPAGANFCKMILLNLAN